MQRRQVLSTENDNNNKQEISSGKLRLDDLPSLQQNLAQFGTNNKIGTGYLIPDGMG